MNSFKKIVSAVQTKLADEFTIQNNNISSLDLMELAALSFVHEFVKIFSADKNILVICGPGNNGGDGFAVCRILNQLNYNAKACLVSDKDNLSTDCKSNFNKLSINQLESLSVDFNSFDIVIDAIFGSGLSKKPIGVYKNIINRINVSQKTVVSIDVPSGILCDSFYEPINAVKAHYTITFQRPKLTFFMPETGVFCGKIIITNIGLNESFVQNLASDIYYIDDAVKYLLKKRERFSHKGTYGHALLIGGSYGKIGSILLSSKSALKTGSGLVSAYIPSCGNDIFQTSFPEAMTICDDENKEITSINIQKSFDAIGIGPGLGTSKKTTEAVISFLKNYDKPLVIDADAINILAESKSKFPKKSILTPHPKEFERLVGKTSNSLIRMKMQIDYSKKNSCYIVLKDSFTHISTPEGLLFINPFGNAGMATAGSGDVLTGVLTGLLSQRYNEFEACILGTYLHSKAGDNCLNSTSEQFISASDIINKLTLDL